MYTRDPTYVELDEANLEETRGGVVVIPVIMCLQWGGAAAILGAATGYHLVEAYYRERCG